MNFDIYSDSSISLFLEDINENLERVSMDILKLEKDPENKKIISDIFRGLHSIKGASNTLKYSIIGKVAHNLETLFGKIRNDKLEVSTNIIDNVLDGVQIIRIVSREISKTKQELSIDKLESETGLNFKNYISKLKNSYQDTSKTKKKNKEDKMIKIQEEQKYNKANFKIKVVLHKDDPMKKVRYFIIYKELDNEFGISYSTPSKESLLDKDGDLTDVGTSGSFYIYSTKPKKHIENFVENFNIESFEVKKIKEKNSTLERKNISRDKNNMKSSSSNFKSKEYIKVEKGKLDKLFSIVGELFIEKNIYGQLYKKMEEINLELFNENISMDMSKKINDYLDNYAITNKSQDRSLNSLQDISNSLRMVPLKSTFGKLPIAVRSLSHKLNKKIDLSISGESTEIDKLLATKLENPLLHMIRNSVDHGIETPEERVKNGKSKTGKVKIEAYNSGSNVIIKISDDGKGIDPEKVSQKALKENIISSEDIDKLSKQEKIELIFHPGFSTAKKVSDVSGRGVGMDVVKQNIRSINGTVEVESSKGRGSIFYLKLPLTLAIIRAVLVEINSELFAFSSDDVVKIEKVEKSEIKKLNGNKIINYRGKAVPIIDLRNIYHKSDKIENSKKTHENLIIMKENKRMYGFRVSKFVNQKHIVVKEIEGNYHKKMSILGAAVLGNGKIAMVLDANSLIENIKN